MKLVLKKTLKKMESNNELKEIDIKNWTCYSFDDIIKSDDSDFYNILIGEKSYKIIWLITFHSNLCLAQNHCVLGSMKKMDLLKFMVELDI